jgi:hypothetical protein
MKIWIRAGLGSAFRQPFALVCLFVYELLWGFYLYRYIASVVTPLLHRYPGAGLPAGAAHLFLAEGQFRLTKTDLIEPYVWTLAILLTVRMVVTPLLNAAVYYSLQRTDLNAGYRFFRGMKVLAGAYFLYYLLLVVFSAAPLPWLLGKVAALYEAHYLTRDFAFGLLPYAAGYLVYLFLLQLLIMYVQFGRAARVRLLPSLLCWAGNGHRIVGIALAIGAAGLLLGAAALTASYIWAGLTALIIHQLYPLVRMLLKLWGIAAQHALWRDKVSA